MPHLTAVYRLARQLGGPDRADDLVQETFLRAWILHNAWISQWRKTRLELPVSDVTELSVEPYYDWEGDFVGEELSANMQAALAELPDEYRWAVLLADVEELTYREISDVLDCPIGTVMSRLNRGRRMLERRLRAGHSPRSAPLESACGPSEARSRRASASAGVPPRALKIVPKRS
jgi:RNA polymerase sigma factor (sigma-70 family)